MIPVLALLSLRNPTTVQEEIYSQQPRAQERYKTTRKDNKVSGSKRDEILRLLGEYL